MALEIDIKANDEMEKSALAAADALEKVAKQEEKIDALAAKVAISYKAAKVEAAELAKYTEVYGKAKEQDYGTSKKIAEIGQKDRSKVLAQVSKAYAVTKKVVDKEKEKKELIKKGAIAYAAVTGAILASAAAATALGVAVALSAKTAYDAKRNAAALLDAFTAKRGPEAMRLLDGLATKLGMSFGEVREQFVSFRQAGLSNALSAKLIKMRADLMAVGLSAEAADKEISAVTASADGLGNIAAQRKMAEISRAYGGIGSGAKAAAFALTSVDAAQNKIGNVVSEELAGLWKQIGPEIGKAANQLADFAVKLLKSDEGKAAIDGLASAFKSVASSVGPAITGLGKVFDFLSENKVAVVTALGFAVTALGVSMAVAFGPAIVAATLAAVAVAALPLAIAAAAVGVGMAVQAIVKNWDDIKLLAKEAYSWGSDIVDGLIDGIKGKITAAVDTVKGFATDVSKTFANALGIQSPSKVFAGYGKDTVAGFTRGEERAIAGSAMPLQEAASARVEAPATPTARGGSEAKGGGASFIINVTAPPGSDGEDFGRIIRQQIQLILQAGQLSRGIT